MFEKGQQIVFRTDGEIGKLNKTEVSKGLRKEVFKIVSIDAAGRVEVKDKDGWAYDQFNIIRFELYKPAMLDGAIPGGVGERNDGQWVELVSIEDGEYGYKFSDHNLRDKYGRFDGRNRALDLLSYENLAEPFTDKWALQQMCLGEIVSSSSGMLYKLSEREVVRYDKDSDNWIKNTSIDIPKTGWKIYTRGRRNRANCPTWANPTDGDCQCNLYEYLPADGSFSCEACWDRYMASRNKK